MKNKTIVIMGGGTAGWISALYFLNKSRDLNLNLKVKLISSNDIESIGVGEGTTPLFTNFIENICEINRKEFLKETKGSFKFGIKFDNWNFDNNYYYHLFDSDSNYESKDKKLDYDFIQYAINNNIDVSQEILQKKLHGIPFDLLENNKISLNINDSYAYHFSAKLVVSFLMKKCLEFQEFEYIQGTIRKVNYKEDGYIKNILIEENKTIEGDFYINCLGFKSENILSNEYFENEYWDNYILNNSAFAIQVKNSVLENLEPYTTSTAQEYGWTWKIPQYEKQVMGMFILILL
jgi:tryptophan 7-halogenase